MKRLIHTILDFVMRDQFEYNATPEMKEYVQIKMANANTLRVYFICVIAFILEPVLIAAHDLTMILSGDSAQILYGTWYLILHGTFLLWSILIFAYCLTHKKDKAKLRMQSTIYPISSSFILSIFAMLHILDVYTTGQSDVFTVYFLITAVLFYVDYPKGFVVFSIPFLFFLSGYLLFIPESGVRNGQIINHTAMVVTMTMANLFLYESAYRNHMKDFLIIEKNEQLEFYASKDPLTGMNNRRSFEASILKARISSSSPAALVVMDIDNFKKVNDRYGHPAADLVLIRLASLLDEKMVWPNAAARWGGEEFIIFLQGTDLASAKTSMEVLKKSIQEMVTETEDGTISVTVSFGISMITSNQPEKFYAAYNRADQALYLAKSTGRNRVCLYDDVLEGADHDTV
ncbi:MAG: GGDEF domain-containing protein [Lachnospiraceae bacterium]